MYKENLLKILFRKGIVPTSYELMENMTFEIPLHVIVMQM